MADLESGQIKVENVSECACCAGNSLEQLLAVDRFNLPFGSFLCVDCGLITTSPRIKQESLAYYYDKYYHPLNYGKEDLGGQEALFGAEQGVKIFNRLRPHIEKSAIDILEIGAGVGNVLDEFRARAADESIETNLLGTEYSLQCIERCKAAGVETVLGDVQTVLQLNRRFDIIILSHVFEHFIDLQKELNRLSQLLRDGGLIYIEVPGVYKNHTKDYYDFSFLGYSVHAHMYNFTLVTLNNVLSAGGYKLLEGDEEAYGIFQFTDQKSNSFNNEYTKLKCYLEFLEDNQGYALSQRQVILSLEKELSLREKKLSLHVKELSLREKELVSVKESAAKESSRLNAELQKTKREVDRYQRTVKKVKGAKSEVISKRAAKQPLEKYRAYKKLLSVIDES